MQKSRLELASVMLTVALTSAGHTAELVGDVNRGKSLYEQTGCYACHGLAGQGAQATGPRVSRTQYPFAAFLVVLRHPPKQMPPYESVVLSDQDAADIYAYVRQMPAPPDPKSIPLLEATK
jgi:mono/diheme cytochrome c family protein